MRQKSELFFVDTAIGIFLLSTNRFQKRCDVWVNKVFFFYAKSTICFNGLDQDESLFMSRVLHVERCLFHLRYTSNPAEVYISQRISTPRVGICGSCPNVPCDISEEKKTGQDLFGWFPGRLDRRLN